MPLTIVLTPAELHTVTGGWRKEGHSIGFVPTMGALHAGHMALVETARKTCDQVVASIFINPKQFGPKEDLSRYPRTLEEDKALLEKHGCDLLFLPTPEAAYPQGFCTEIQVKGLSDVLDGVHRPGHCTGVATVVSILLNIVRPDRSFFGEKDYQQLQIIRRMAQDLHLPGDIIGCPTVREPDGLALSSRNRYLSPKERKVAPKLYETMLWVKEHTNDEAALDIARQRLLASGFTNIDYLECRHGESLASIPLTDPHSRLFAAAWLGNTRLIDNCPLSSH